MLSTVIRTPNRPLMLCIFLCLTTATSAAEPAGYSLHCKGGGNHTLNFPPVQFYHQGFRGTVVGFSFKKSPRSAAAGLQPGTCAWMDRPLNNKEPATLLAKFPDVFLYISAVSNNGRSGVIYRYAGNSSHKAKLERFLKAIRSGDRFTVRAYNDGRNLVVRKFSQFYRRETHQKNR